MERVLRLGSHDFSIDMNNTVFTGVITELMDWFHPEQHTSPPRGGSSPCLSLSGVEFTFAEYQQMILQTQQGCGCKLPLNLMYMDLCGLGTS